MSEPVPATRPAAATSALVVAVDGPGGSGKSTVARAVAAKLGLRYLDTGAMYRAVTRRVLDAGVDPADADAVAAVAERVSLEPGTDPAAPRIRADGQDVTDAVRSAEVTAAVSAVSAVPAVRTRMVALQQSVIGEGGIVVEGRDIGTTVAPAAAVKIFLTADARTRALRRTLESTSSPDEGRTAATEADLRRRDALDSSRAASPLTQAPDAVPLDTTDVDVDAVVGAIVAIVEERTGPARRTSPTSAPTPGSIGGAVRGPIDEGPLVRSRHEPKGWLMRLARAIGRVLFPLVFRMRVIGRDRLPSSGPVIIAGNHTGFLDGPAVYSTARRMPYFFIKAELYGGAHDRLLDWLGQIPINRGRPDRTALQRGLAVLAAGHPLGMFPEGTRGAGDLETVQHGIAYLALRAGCPVVPVACYGTRDALPHGSRMIRFRTPVDVVFGAPFTVSVDGDPRSRRAVAQAAEEIRTHLVAHLVEAARLTGRGTGERPDGGR